MVHCKWSIIDTDVKALWQNSVTCFTAIKNKWKIPPKITLIKYEMSVFNFDNTCSLVNYKSIVLDYDTFALEFFFLAPIFL